MMQDKLMCVVVMSDGGEIEVRTGCGGRGRGATGVILQGRFGSRLSDAWDPGRWEGTLGFCGSTAEGEQACVSIIRCCGRGFQVECRFSGGPLMEMEYWSGLRTGVEGKGEGFAL